MHLQSINCALCNSSVEETVDHLFLHRNLARECWNLVA
jgi:hypothetical protein